MTPKENLIFYSIFVVLIVGIGVLLYIGEYMNGDGGDKSLIENSTSSQNDETHGEEDSMINNITPIILAVAALVGIMFGTPTFLEKMRKRRLDKLKDRMLDLFSEGWNHQRIHTPDTEQKFFEELGPKFQKRRYKKLHQIAYDELGREGKNDAWSHKNLMRQAIEEKQKENLKVGMPGPGGMIYKRGGQIIQKDEE